MDVAAATIMLYELIRSIVQKVLQDKILLGLLIIGLLGIFVGASMGDEKASKKDVQAEATPAAGSAPAEKQTIQPNLAQDFVSWWLTGAMDYNAATAMQSHNQAMAWMTPDAARSFAGTFWTPQIAESVSAGRLVAAFQPTGIQAQAINPDGSVVVSVSGTMVVQSNGQPVVQQFLGSFLVRQEKDGLRVAGLDTHQSAVPGGTIY